MEPRKGIPLDFYLNKAEPDLEANMMIESKQLKAIREAFELFLADQNT